MFVLFDLHKKRLTKLLGVCIECCNCYQPQIMRIVFFTVKNVETSLETIFPLKIDEYCNGAWIERTFSMKNVPIGGLGMIADIFHS